MKKIAMLFVVSILLLSGCATQSVVKSRYFWPIGGLEPKVEYVAFYEADKDVKHAESTFAQSILGVEQGRRPV